MASAHNRRHHNEIPYECMNLSLNSKLDKYKVSNEQLSEAIKNAIPQGEKYPNLKNIMLWLLSPIRELKEKADKAVREEIQRIKAQESETKTQ
jgi:hypothetical protein